MKNNFNQETIPYMAHEGEGFVFSNNSADINDNWLITPQISVKSASTLKFRALSYNSNNESIEDMNVLISTGSNVIEDFTVTASEIRDIPFRYENSQYIYTEYYVSLQSFANQDIYIAFQSITSNGGLLLLDHVEISGGSSGINNQELTVSSFELKQNYPNPFNPTTLINYNLPNIDYNSAEIVVFNTMGLMV